MANANEMTVLLVSRDLWHLWVDSARNTDAFLRNFRSRAQPVRKGHSTRTTDVRGKVP